MSDTPDPARLARLEKRLAEMKQAQEPIPKEETHFSQAQHAWRMVVELIVGIVLGFGIGYGLDVLFGTMPWFLIPFTMLGFAAGINVMLKTAKELQKENAAHDAAIDEGN